MIGKTLGHYQIIEKLGQGGMGVVYKARDSHLDRFVALKVLPPEKVADPERKRRFVQEAKAASALNHPNIIHIYDVDQAEGIDFIAMEHVSGKTLDELILRKGMRLSVALKCAVQITDALARAHGAGIIHRDLKPSNVMVDEHGLVKVLDFGLAKLTEQGISEDDSTATVGVKTEEGAVVGTAAYMSPEQAEGKKADARSDIFSFGAVLYEMVTGQRAFVGDSKISTLAAVLQKEPRPLPADTPHDLATVITRCLRKDPGRRFQHIADVTVQLEELMHEPGARTAAPENSVRPRGRWQLAAITVGAPLLALCAWYALQNPGPPPPLRVVPITSYPGVETYPSLSPDGRQVAFTWNGEKQNNFDIYVKVIGSEPPLRLTSDPAADTNPAWSPDGRQIAFVREQGDMAGIYLISPLGGPERKLTDFRLAWSSVLRRFRCLSWAPNGKWVALAEKEPQGGNGIFLIPVEQGERRRLTSNPIAFDHSPAISPDGRFLAYAYCTGLHACDVHLLELGPDFAPKGRPRRLTQGSVSLMGIAWTADGRSVLDAEPDGSAVHLWRVAVSGTPKPERVEAVGSKVLLPVTSRVGSRLVYVQGGLDMDIQRMELGAPAEGFISSTLFDSTPQFSPDGAKIAFESSRSGSGEIWVCRRDGSNILQLTKGPGKFQGSPQWSPDGRWITFDSQGQDGHWDIYVIDAAGGQPRPLTRDPSNEQMPSFSRDGHSIYYRSNRSGRVEIWRIPATGGQAVQVTDSGGEVAIESFDGKSVFYSKQAVDPGLLFARPSSGGPERRVLDWVVGRAFFPVQNGIYYFGKAVNDGVWPLQFFDFATGSVRTLTRISGQLGWGLTVSPEQRLFLFCVYKPPNDDLMLVENFR